MEGLVDEYLIEELVGDDQESKVGAQRKRQKKSHDTTNSNSKEEQDDEEESLSQMHEESMEVEQNEDEEISQELEFKIWPEKVSRKIIFDFEGVKDADGHDGFEKPMIDIIHRIGQNWDDDLDSQFENPASRIDQPLLEYITSEGNNITSITAHLKIKPKDNKRTNWPFIVIDLKNVSVKLEQYEILILNEALEFMPIKWKIEGSNNGRDWILIQNEIRAKKEGKRTRYKSKLRSRKSKKHQHWNNSGYDNFETLYTIKNKHIGYYSMFKMELTARCYNQQQGDLSGHKILCIEDIYLFGDTKRKVCKMKRINEVRTKIKPFPTIRRGQIHGDPNKVLNIINESLQHNECKEYKEDIPGLNVELYDYQKRGVHWMLDMEKNGNSKYGIYCGLLCDEMGLGKTVQTISMMFSMIIF